jgi:hypothetical protein
MSAHEPQVTHNHDQIQSWAEERDGRPTRVRGTGDEEDAGILRIDFPGYSGDGDLEEISWSEFFDKFEESQLALLYQEETKSGEVSNFNKLIRRR